MSSFVQLPNTDAGFAKLEQDLESGEWHRRHDDLLALDAIDLGYRVIVAHPHSH